MEPIRVAARSLHFRPRAASGALALAEKQGWLEGGRGRRNRVATPRRQASTGEAPDGLKARSMYLRLAGERTGLQRAPEGLCEGDGGACIGSGFGPWSEPRTRAAYAS